MMKKLITILAVTIIVAGCSKGFTESEVSDGWGAAEIKLVTLSDGTKCATLIGYNKGSIHCNWKE